MKRRKKGISLLLVTAMLLMGSLTACNQANSGEESSTGATKESTEFTSEDAGASSSEASGEETDTSENDVPESSSPSGSDNPSEGSEDVAIPGRVYIEGNQFMVNNGQELWINGVNTPWDNWNDFGGNFNEDFWDSHFALLHELGINASRVWITCNGDVGIQIDDSGYIAGATDAHWEDLDSLFSLAEKHGIYIMATLISFDHFKNTYQNYEKWRAMLQDTDKIDSYIENYVIPFCRRYDSYDSLWSIDLCNEPDWVFENEECGRLSWQDIGNYFSRAAAAIHENSDILVTVGFSMVKYNSERYEGNYGSDTFLQSCYHSDQAYLDFYSTHYYEWQAPWFDFPFNKSPKDFHMDTDKPIVIGEFPAYGMTGNEKNSVKMSAEECYLGCYQNGWNGAMAWTSNGVDFNGDYTNIQSAAKAILELGGDKIIPHK